MEFLVGESALYNKQAVQVLAAEGSGYQVVRHGEENQKTFWVPARCLSAPAPRKLSPKWLTGHMYTVPHTPRQPEAGTLLPTEKLGFDFHKTAADKILTPAEEVPTLDPFIEWLRGNGHLSASMPNHILPKFADRYAKAAGREFDAANEPSVSITLNGRARWYSLRIVYPAPPTDIKEPAEAKDDLNRGQRSRQISSNEFCWELIAQGFRFGKQVPNVAKAA